MPQHRDLAVISTKDATNPGEHVARGGHHPSIDEGAATPAPSDTQANPLAHRYSAETDTNNVRLKTDVLELEDLIETTAEVQVEGVRSSESLLGSRIASSRARIVDFDQDYRWATTSGFSRDKYIELLQMHVTSQTLDKYLRIVQRVRRLDFTPHQQQHAADEPATPAPNTPRDCDAESVAMSRATTTVSISGAADAVTRACARVQEIAAEFSRPHREPIERTYLTTQLANALNALFPPHGDGTARSFFAINDIANTDVLKYLKESLESTSARMHELEQAAEEAQRACAEEAVDDHTAAALRSKMQACIHAYEEALTLSRDRLNSVMMGREDDGNLRSAADRAREQCEGWLSEQRASRTELIQHIASDNSAMEKEHAKRVAESEAAHKAYVAARDASLQKMDALGVEQEKLWRVVEDYVGRIGNLSAERTKLVHTHLDATQVEYKRQRYHAEFVFVHERHTQHLELLKKLSADSVAALDSLETQLEQLTTQVEETLNVDAGIEDMRLAELQRFVRLYPPYDAATNRLKARDDARLVLLQRAALVAEGNASITQGALDPKRVEYVKRAETERAAADTLEAQVRQLGRAMETWDTRFEAVAEQCNAHRVTYSDPRDNGEAEWRAVVDKTRRAAQEAQRGDANDVDGAAAAADGLRSHADAVQQATAQRRANRTPSPARKQGHTTPQQRQVPATQQQQQA